MIILETVFALALTLLIVWEIRRRRTWRRFAQAVRAVTQEDATVKAIAALYPEGVQRQFAAKVYALYRMGKGPAWTAIVSFGEAIDAAARRERAS